MENIPFLLEARMDSPLILSPDAYLTLDSLLSASCQLFNEDSAVLPLASTEDVYHGSAGILVGNPVSLEASFVSRMTPGDYSNEHLLPNEKRGLIINLKAFPDKARLDRYTANHVPKIVWFGLGDPSKTLEILSRLPGLGKRCNSGYGQVSSFFVQEISRDYSFTLPDGTPARPIPVAHCQELGIDTSSALLDRVTYKPDYFDYSHATMCVLPVNRQITENHIKVIIGLLEAA
jgi:hypothetical protein